MLAIDADATKLFAEQGWIDVAIPRRAQSPTVPLTKPSDSPLFLAELPHVGEDSPSTKSRSPASAFPQQNVPAVSTHPAFAELVPPTGRFNQTRSRSERSDRLYVDHAHAAEVMEQEVEETLQSLPRPLSYAPTQPRFWRRFVARVHDHLAPFAGFIVTLALLSSAGLLYWIISRGQPSDFDPREIEFLDGTLKVQVLESNPLASSIPILESPKTTEDALESVEANQGLSPNDKPTGPHKIGSQKPSTESTAAAPLGAIFFPTTNTPEALDLSKAFEELPAETSGEIQSLPEVAERDVPSSAGPMAR